MFAVAVLRPTEPRGDGLLVGLCIQWRVVLVKPGCGTAEILFYALSHELLFPVEVITDIIKTPPVSVITVFRDRKDLPIILDLQFKFLLDIRLDKLVENLRSVSLLSL